MKYEAPVLAKVGKAETVILGQIDFGNDIGGQYWIPELEFLSDEDSNE